MKLTSNKIQTLCITSGKGGVGKTTLTVNLASQLAKRGKKILIFDGDLGMANVDILFGVRPRGNLLSVINGEQNIFDILTPLSSHIDLISGGSGLAELNRLNGASRRSLLDLVGLLNHKYDYCLIDTSPGLSDNVLYLNAASHLSLLIIHPDPTSLADAYALIKVLSMEFKESRFAIICNQVKDDTDGFGLFRRFSEVVYKFLNIGIDYWGSIPFDHQLKKCTQIQKVISIEIPMSPSSLAIEKISQKWEETASKLQTKDWDKGGIQLFQSAVFY